MNLNVKRLSILGILVSINIAHAQAIDFETLSGGTPTIDQQLISDQYVSEFGVRFDLVDPLTLLSIGSPQIAKVGAPQTAFAACGPDTPLDGEGVGSSFLTDDNAITNQAGTLLLTYTDPVAQAAGAILDIDGRNGPAFEAWTIEALDENMSVIDTIVLTAPGGVSPCGGPNGSGDGRAMGFFFDHPAADVYFILLRYTGTASSIGLAFDNFTPTTIPPAPVVTVSASSDPACLGDIVVISASPQLGLPGFQYQWQQALTPGVFTDIAGEISSTLNAPALLQARDYRVIVTDAITRQATSDIATVVATQTTNWTLKVETAAGSGVFDTIATNITPFIFDESLPTAYGWTSSQQYYHGPEPVLALNRSHMFLTIAPGGQSLVIVHDAADPNTGGRAEMQADFVGVTPDFAFRDDPTGDTYQGGGTSTLKIRHNWNAPNTDGWAAGPLTGSWSAGVQFKDGFTGDPTISGLADWYFYSGDGLIYQLPLEEDRIVLIEAVCNPCPADLTNDGVLNFFDVSAFLTAFSTMNPIADFTNDGVWNFFDVSAFLSAFSAGCP